jgi:recombinational DNA repair protein (RecF pathway)
MPVYKAEALILRTYKLGEADRIVVFLTRDRGKKRGVAKGARRQRSRFIGGLEPMTRAGVQYYEREQRELVRINFVEPVSCPMAIRRRAPRPGAGTRLLRRADRRVGARSARRRAALSPGIVDGGRDCERRASGAAGALFRILAAAPAGSTRP